MAKSRLKGYRLLRVEGVLYRYKVGESYVDIRRPDGSRLTPNFQELTDLSWSEIEKGIRKRWFSITPGLLSDYLRGHGDDDD